MSDDVLSNYNTVVREIATAERRAERPTGAATLVAVSKVHGPARILPVLTVGHRVFGENRIQDAMGKWPDLKARFPDVTLHLIGPLQTNKVKEAVALFDVIETLDRPKLAKALAAEMVKQDRALPCFIQVNTGLEPQKAGVLPDQLGEFVGQCRALGLKVVGLMCIPPVDQAPAPHFAFLGELARRNGLDLLSMGMTSDFATAIELGATHVRVGTAIFGARPKP